MSFAHHIKAIFNDPHIGVDAVYNDGSTDTDVRAILERDVEVWQDHTVIHQDQIALLSSQVSNPKPGHTVTIDGTAYELVNRIKDDELETKWSVNKQ